MPWYVLLRLSFCSSSNSHCSQNINVPVAVGVFIQHPMCKTWMRCADTFISEETSIRNGKLGPIATRVARFRDNLQHALDLQDESEKRLKERQDSRARDKAHEESQAKATNEAKTKFKKEKKQDRKCSQVLSSFRFDIVDNSSPSVFSAGHQPG